MDREIKKIKKLDNCRWPETGCGGSGWSRVRSSDYEAATPDLVVVIVVIVVAVWRWTYRRCVRTWQASVWRAVVGSKGWTLKTSAPRVCSTTELATVTVNTRTSQDST